MESRSTKGDQNNMLIIGDHKQTDRKFKYENYPIEKNRSKIKQSTKRKLILNHNSNKKIDYTIWLRSINQERINYLKEIGIKDQKQLQTLMKMSFNILPYDIRSNLQRLNANNPEMVRKIREKTKGILSLVKKQAY